VSGIAGVIRFHGAPADADVVERMAASMAGRGPDGASVRVNGSAGLAHALLRTGDGADDVPQPLSLDGTRWIAADARIDGRAELVRALRANGVQTDAERPAAELILHALHVWGERAPEHLLGDFAFAVWDGRRLLCARDLFGLKPLYYAALPDAFVFSNSLDTVRLHPGVGAALDDEWIADFLVHGDPRSVDRTVYADIRLLPPGHLLVAEEGRISIRRYASLPTDTEPLRLRGPAEYAERFDHALRQAVADRLPRGRATLLLSGGRDSTALAATWRALVDTRATGTELRALTAFHATLMPDREPVFAAMAADALRIPREQMAVDGYPPFGRWEAPELYRPQPTASPLLAIEADQYRRAARHGPVLLTGQGADALLRESPSRLTRLVVGGHPLRAAAEAARYVRWHGRIPRPGIRTWRAGQAGALGPEARAPAWISPEFARRVELDERLAAWNAARGAPFTHPLHPEARGYLAGVLWPVLGALWDPGSTGVPLEVRHPYLDLRLVRLVLSIPPAQWYNDKGLLRIAMRGRLPKAVLTRPKTPVADDPLAVRARALGDGWLGGRTVDRAVSPWVDVARVPGVAGGGSPHPPRRLYQDIRPLALSLWLRRPA
jgi:asparagine synthase (glutamine-hydrolysing)